MKIEKERERGREGWGRYIYIYFLYINSISFLCSFRFLSIYLNNNNSQIIITLFYIAFFFGVTQIYLKCIYKNGSFSIFFFSTFFRYILFKFGLMGCCPSYQFDLSLFLSLSSVCSYIIYILYFNLLLFTNTLPLYLSLSLSLYFNIYHPFLLC